MLEDRGNAICVNDEIVKKGGGDNGFMSFEEFMFQINRLWHKPHDSLEPSLEPSLKPSLESTLENLVRPSLEESIELSLKPNFAPTATPAFAQSKYPSFSQTLVQSTNLL